MTISVLWTVSCEIFWGLKGSFSFLCKIGITDLNYHCQQELSFVWRTFQGSQKNKVLNVLGEEDGAGLDARALSSLYYLIFKDELIEEMVISRP